jgi:hypothetical protein
VNISQKKWASAGVRRHVAVADQPLAEDRTLHQGLSPQQLARVRPLVDHAIQLVVRDQTDHAVDRRAKIVVHIVDIQRL